MNEQSDGAGNAGPGGPGPSGPAAGAPGPRDAGVGDAVGDLLGKLLRRGRVEVEKATRWGRERLTLRQLRSDRDRMYQKLGKETRLLIEGGDLDHPGLRRGVERIKELEARILEIEDQLRAVGLDPSSGEESGEDRGGGDDRGGNEGP